MKHVFFYDSPIGKIGIEESADAISRVFFAGDKPSPEAECGETPLIRKAAAQIAEYFAGKRKAFDLPLALHGTAFQLSVWRALQAIPIGETRSYLEVAVAVGNPRAPRAVGMANNRNPVAIIVPCHRVIGSNGSLVGYAGGLPAKQYLLELEGRAA
jgi:methylated-DNA-[protein]-cysteine S-methyltransferase